VQARGLAVVSDEGALGEAVDAALAAQPDTAEKVRGRKVQAVGALVGAVMKATRGQADAAVVRVCCWSGSASASSRLRLPGWSAGTSRAAGSRGTGGATGRLEASGGGPAGSTRTDAGTSDGGSGWA
jgi:hypothetical protein